MMRYHLTADRVAHIVNMWQNYNIYNLIHKIGSIVTSQTFKGNASKEIPISLWRREKKLNH